MDTLIQVVLDILGDGVEVEVEAYGGDQVSLCCLNTADEGESLGFCDGGVGSEFLEF